MVENPTKWISNFSGGESTARQIIESILQEAPEMTADEFLQSLTKYRDGRGLEFIDLLQIRDQSMFDGRCISDPPEPTRKHISDLALELIQEKGVLIRE